MLLTASSFSPVIPSEREPSLLGERESRDPAFLLRENLRTPERWS